MHPENKGNRWIGFVERNYMKWQTIWGDWDFARTICESMQSCFLIAEFAYGASKL